MWVRLGCFAIESALTVFTLAHPDRLINLLALSTEIVANVLPIGERLEHREDLQLLALPRFEVKCLWILKVSEVGQWIELSNKSKCQLRHA